MSFWIIATVITAIIGLIAFYPLFWHTAKDKGINRNKLNKAFYFNRLRELNDDEDQGLLDNSKQIKTELQQALLQDIPEQEEAPEDKKSFGKIWGISGFLTLLILATLSYMQVGSWQQQAMLEKTYQKLPYFYERLKDETKPLDKSELQQLTIALRLKLQKEPENAQNWWKLGQIAMVQEKGQLAFDSFAQAHKFEPENIKYKLSYVRFLLFSQDKMENVKGIQLLKEILRVEHTNLEALSLLAFHYFEKENYERAMTTWIMMLRLLPKDDPKVAIIEKSILIAQQKLEQQ
ncbi:c-type cytochrome biogenesis protein CcmI [Pasteurella skyensis]|uniref:C-type cytochrome biogenesis protein CcmI n=1 Tax=Phocoenobacter skyensis TaxID=97481 RepID=A0AAJ6NB38_9PAST|nr:c-type cytochrome biogenesis protein CcmI [Pasteurella skyensis]MDP8163301.1 c-type cytochrome biogenesis protein CcmI [Pasteurella skyensis]MDP8173502.1 c-type cytochrome biogenesis protein CcmI [Pasteurella skyensis]MDP8177269.1 c-type cytochrome biogenesis protein CcmI [Pasteurella skyensis]MDP8179769.1 c-type cytochrome biogenesis protein CcmI [Pasteurella skyensis]MDP8183883.1 c-type cytochrome biogenesis protein CcmI [Pasteurella skyensis]